MTTEPEPDRQPPQGEESTVPVQRVLRLEELLGDEREVLIQHGGEYYRLRLTRNGRLLLTK